MASVASAHTAQSRDTPQVQHGPNWSSPSEGEAPARRAVPPSLTRPCMNFSKAWLRNYALPVGSGQTISGADSLMSHRALSAAAWFLEILRPSAAPVLPMRAGLSMNNASVSISPPSLAPEKTASSPSAAARTKLLLEGPILPTLLRLAAPQHHEP